MTAIKLTILAGLLFALSGCVIPFGASTGPGDNRSAYFNNDGDGDTAPQSSEDLRVDHDKDSD